MKKEIEQLVDRLADKSLTFGCEFYSVFYSSRQKIVAKRPDSIDFWTTHRSTHIDGMLASDHVMEDRVFGHPLRVGDFLEKIRMPRLQNELLDWWSEVGFKKSLQEIIDECEWEPSAVLLKNNGKKKQLGSDMTPKEIKYQRLFEFLLRREL